MHTLNEESLRGIQMQLSLKIAKTIAVISALTATSVIGSAGAASAKPIYVKPNTNVGNVVVVDNNKMGFGGAYIGGGFAAGVTNGGQQEDAANLGGNIQGRVNIPNTPISARGAVLFSGNNAAIMPIVTYDVPVAKNTNVYVGGGYSFVEKNGVHTPLGNKSAPVVTLGAESSVTRDVVIYGDAKWGINAYQNSPADALSFQGGVGYRF
jgi:hypothetical protein